MDKNYIKLLPIFFLFVANIIVAQQKKIWIKKDDVKINNTFSESEVIIKKYQTFQLKVADFKEKLKNAPNKDVDLRSSNFKIQFPNLNGELTTFWVKETPVMDPILAKKYPNNKSYSGIGLNDNSIKIKFSVNELGLHAMILTENRKVQYINPVKKNKNNYKVYAREDLSVESIDFQCFSKNFESVAKSALKIVNGPSDLILRKYRLALAGTGEYSSFHIDAANGSGGTDAEKKAIVLAAMTTAITRINTVFENDLAITLELVSNNDELIYLDSATDPYTNDNGANMLDENQTTCDVVIGTSNYDIGHVLSTDGSVSQAALASTCVGSSKARGVTGSPNPTGDSFYFDFIIHELGHQFGANHTFNGDASNCAGGNRNDATAVEPGSGSTLMGYASLCSPQNVQQHSDLYFHAISIDEIWTNIISGSNNCAITSNFVNNLNVPSANAGDDLFIPKSTAFKLVGQGSDADNDPITFCWEQNNNEINSIPPSDTDTDGTIYRSVKPSSDNFRYFPRLNTVIGGNLSSTWEVTPSVAREMNFILTVRDNNLEGGQIGDDDMKVTIVETAGPFLVTSQNTSDIVWNEGNSETITWDVAGTIGNGINTSNVNILLSVDGGKTFPTVLILNTPNDGSQMITVPDVSAPSCRIMVEAVGNFYYAVNTTFFSIGEFVTECADYISVDIPKDIPDNSPGGILSTINVTDQNIIIDVKVTVEISHPWIADITLQLESPQGTVVELINGQCFGANNEDMKVVFDDSASVLICGNTPPVINGIIKPFQELSAFSNENPQGIWKLKVADEGADDTGKLENWSLEICTSRPLSNNSFTLGNFLVYPNPSQGEFNISFIQSDAKVEINLFDLLGRRIKKLQFVNENEYFNESINLIGLARGIYLLQIKNGKNFSAKKIQIY